MLERVHMEKVRRAPAGPALRRPAAARRPGARADHQPARAAARRAALGARPVPAGADARGAQAAAGRYRPHLRPRHARPGRGDGAGRHHGGDERRPARPGRPAARDLQRAGDRLRRPLHRRPQRVARRPAGLAAARWPCAPTAPPCAAPATARSASTPPWPWSSTGHLGAGRASRRRRAARSRCCSTSAPSTPPRWPPAQRVSLSWPRAAARPLAA